MFYLYLEQAGGGCDYTIGCGNRLFKLKGATLEEAREDAKQYFDRENYGYGRGDYSLTAANIFKFEMDAMPVLEQILKQEQEEDRLEKLAEKRAQLERLKKELGE